MNVSKISCLMCILILMVIKTAEAKDVSLFALTPTSEENQCKGFTVEHGSMFGQQAIMMQYRYGVTCNKSYSLMKNYSRIRFLLGISDSNADGRCNSGYINSSILINNKPIDIVDLEYGDEPKVYDINISDAAILELKMAAGCTIGNPTLIPKNSNGVAAPPTTIPSSSSDSSTPSTIVPFPDDDVTPPSGASTESLEERVARLEKEVANLSERLKKYEKIEKIVQEILDRI